MAGKRPTIKDVAELAGVSFKTVSRVINDQPGVSEEMKERVQAAIDELGYVVNYSARSLASGQRHAIGVVIPRFTDPRVLDLVYHIGDLTETHKLPLIILNRPDLRDESGVQSFIGSGLLAALLLVAPRSLDRYLPLIQSLQIPTAVIESRVEPEPGQEVDVPIPCIVSDNRGGAERGVECLIELGHRRIAYISGTSSSQSRLRLAGYRQALRNHGLAFRKDYVLAGGWTWSSGYECACQAVQLSEPPTALFCANDNMALGSMCALKERGYVVPEDMSILGFDDIPAARWSQPALSTVRQQTKAMVAQAIDLLLRARDGERVESGVRALKTELIERASCAPPPSADSSS